MCACVCVCVWVIICIGAASPGALTQVDLTDWFACWLDCWLASWLAGWLACSSSPHCCFSCCLIFLLLLLLLLFLGFFLSFWTRPHPVAVLQTERGQCCAVPCGLLLFDSGNEWGLFVCLSVCLSVSLWWSGLVLTPPSLLSSLSSLFLSSELFLPVCGSGFTGWPVGKMERKKLDFFH